MRKGTDEAGFDVGGLDSARKAAIWGNVMASISSISSLLKTFFCYGSPPSLDQYRREMLEPRTVGGRRLRGSRRPVATPDRPLVSIITVVRNGAISLPRTIESVRAQTYTPIEYIVIDGGSTDGTLDFIRSNEDVTSYWVGEPDSGIYAAFNKGLAELPASHKFSANRRAKRRPGAAAARRRAGWRPIHELFVVKTDLSRRPILTHASSAFTLWTRLHV